MKSWNTVLRGWMDDWIVRNIKTSKTFFYIKIGFFPFPGKNYPWKQFLPLFHYFIGNFFRHGQFFCPFIKFTDPTFFLAPVPFSVFLRARFFSRVMGKFVFPRTLCQENKIKGNFVCSRALFFLGEYFHFFTGKVLVFTGKEKKTLDYDMFTGKVCTF